MIVMAKQFMNSQLKNASWGDHHLFNLNLYLRKSHGHAEFGTNLLGKHDKYPDELNEHCKPLRRKVYVDNLLGDWTLVATLQ